jgi:prephenate dehydrogenase
LAASIEIANVRLAGNSDHGLLVAILGVGRVGRWSISILGVAGRSSGGDGQDSGDQELKKNRISTSNRCDTAENPIVVFTTFMLTTVDLLNN